MAIGTILGDLAILGCIKALYAVYMRNIRDAFEMGEKLAPPKFHPVIRSKSITEGQNHPLERKATGEFDHDLKKGSINHSHDDSTLLKGSSDTKSLLNL